MRIWKGAQWGFWLLTLNPLTPGVPEERITEDGELRITEDGVLRETENFY